MVNSPTSYLQTLAKEDAIAFVASLQSVKAHLSQELQWIEAQVEQKTVQLQGMETLLAEAIDLGLLTADTAATPTPAMELLGTAIAALPTPATPKQPRGQQEKTASTKLRGTKAAADTHSAAKTPSPKPSMPPSGKTRRNAKASPLQQFLKSQWQEQALTDSVSKILDRAAAPLSTDEVMAALYDGLPSDTYDRAKHSLANILSVGRSKGMWKSTGRGRYAGNADATPKP